MSNTDDEFEQRCAWKQRLVRALLERKHDDETLAHMLEAGLNQAHAEGLRDAAYICDKVAEAHPKRVGPVAMVLARQMRRLEQLNAAPHS